MEYDVVIVGAGPSGLAAAIRLKQLAARAGREVSVCVVEKGSEIGAHILSGAVLEPRALDELIPDWREQGRAAQHAGDRGPLPLPDRDQAFRLPTPPQMHNHGNYIISLGNVCRWLAQQAEALGVEIYPGFAAAEVLYDEDGRVRGVATGDMGIGKDGEPTELPARHGAARQAYTLFAEGCRGSLTKTLIERFNLRDGVDPQTYGIGIKELWEVDPAKHKPGLVVHTVGWPLDRPHLWRLVPLSPGEQSGRGRLRHRARLPEPATCRPFDELQRFKTHPAIRPIFEGGRRIAYGARALNEGGFQSIPKLVFPGGALIGDTAGFLNVPKIKGTHTAMKSGMVAAEAVFAALARRGAAPRSRPIPRRCGRAGCGTSCTGCATSGRRSMRACGAASPTAALDTYVLRGKAPWTFKHHADHTSAEAGGRASEPIDYPKPDGVITFDRLSSVFISNTNHEEDQPAHLTLKDATRADRGQPGTVYDGPEQRYCPAGVYEIVDAIGEAASGLQINAQNCVHCKTCDIKDPTQNIDWVAPEGGGGPNYIGGM